MALPKRLARFNLLVTNRVVGPFARRLPGFAVVSHVGRRSGRVYRTPVNLYRADDRLVPLPIRQVLRLVKVSEFMLLRRAVSSDAATGAAPVPARR